jgi:hypothetical protein
MSFLAVFITTWEMIPNPGKIKIYTSGCPKNQKRCWNRMGSPPPEGSKKEVFKLRSVNNIVMAPANTGRESNNKTAVTITDHTNKEIRSNSIVRFRMFKVVQRKLIAPRIEEIPAKCKEKIAKSTEGPL